MGEVLKLEHITELDLSGNPQMSTADFNKLSRYTRMSVLWLGDCGLTTTEFLDDMKDLVVLNIQNNELTRFELNQFNNLNTLDISGNKLTFLDLSNLPELKFLYAAKNRIEEINLTNIFSLLHLSLENNNLASLSLENLKALTFLNLNQNSLTDIHLENLLALSVLSLDDNHLKNFTSDELVNTLNIHSLYLSNNDLISIEAISQLASLSHLSMINNRDISSYSPLSNRTLLSKLYLTNNNLTDSQANQMKNLIALDHIALGGSQLTTVDFVNEMPNLYSLMLNDNALQTIDALRSTPNLDLLAIQNNHLTDLGPLSSTKVNIYDPGKFIATNQQVLLPTTQLALPTPLTLQWEIGILPLIEWETAGSLEENYLRWDQPGVNTLTWSSDNGLFSGTVVQEVTMFSK